MGSTVSKKNKYKKEEYPRNDQLKGILNEKLELNWKKIKRIRRMEKKMSANNKVLYYG
jgi:hypothetical protein